MKKWIRILALFSAVGMVAVGCGSDAESPAPTTAAPTTAAPTTAAPSADDAGPLRVAIVAPSASDDLAFSQSMVDSVNALDRDIDLSITDGTFIIEDAAAAIRGYAEDGVEVVIAHGTQYGASLMEIAPDFPDVTFAWGTASDTQGLDNVFAYAPAADEGGYVNGWIASSLTETGVIGVVGPIEAGDAVAYINGFEAGALAGGAAEVNITYTGSFGDVALAAEAAEAHLSNNADVLTGTAQMVVGAVGVAADNDIPWFGTQANQTSLAPDLVVASQVYHWEVVLEEMLSLRDSGVLGGQAFEINLANGGLVIEFNDAFALPAGVRDEAETMITGIGTGTVDISAPDAGPLRVAIVAPSASDGDLNFYNWSEYMDPDLITAFQDQYGVTVTEDFYPSNEEMFARVEAGGSGYDMIIPSDYMVSILISESMILPVPAAAVPNKPNVADTFADPPYDPGAVYTAAYQWGTTGVGVDIGITGEVPHTWGLLFDAELAEQYDLSGKITILDDPRETMGAALKYLGYSLNSTSESELAEAEAVIADAVSRVAAFDSDQYDELIVTGESVVGHGYSGNFLWGFEEGDSEYTYFVPDEGGTIWVDNMAVLTDAPHPCTAFTFMNFLLDAENGAQLTNYNWYASPNAASEQYIDPEVLDNPIIYPTDMSLLEFIEDTGDFEIEYTDALSRARS